MITVPVDLAERSYDVIVGPGARHQLGAVLPAEARRAVVVTQAGIGLEVDPGVEFDTCVVPDGEAAKSMREVEKLCRSFSLFGLSRSDVVVAVGGGVVTDLVGFAASIFHRGISYVNVATSLLAQVDAAIGGKTGVNLPEGKNLAGTFWQPSAVLCDVDALMTLPQREHASGRGEMVKYAFIDARAAHLAAMELTEQIGTCIEVKASVISRDEREGLTPSGEARGPTSLSAGLLSRAPGRMVLNYGHTLAHALEAAAFGSPRGWDLRHGEAVSIGLVFASELALRLGRIDAERVDEHRRLLGEFDLPVHLPHGVLASELVVFMARDKKATGGLTFVLDGPAGLEIVRDVANEDVVATLCAMGSQV